ncbi:MAG: UDP-glucose/GDP-mannose dehydrogenase family protein [Phycisphaerales bacterium]|nr:UDP-glucose/GDP-mannose dehydrogenase family protein [Phycisphaerales bacterium]
MRISIFGMGYVGVVSSACLVRDGHEVIGVDPVEAKVADINAGRTPIREDGVAEMLATGHAAGLLSASTHAADALAECDLAWICVGTPSQVDGGIDLRYVESCIREIGSCLKHMHARPLIVLRSTVLPGTTRETVIPLLEKSSGLTVGKDLHIVFHPEFLREGNAVHDFDEPPKIVIGEETAGAGDALEALYAKYDAPHFRAPLEVAELVKYSDNLFHAIKVVFANEMGAIAHAVGADAREVADIFCSDTKLNINPYYLRPGFAYGGSCLPKDLRAILRLAQQKNISVPLFESAPQSNRQLVEHFVDRVLRSKPQSVGMVGLAFKPGTDDMRESPYVEVAKRLLGEGMTLAIYDPAVDPSRLIGSNKQAVQTALRHLEQLIVHDIAALDACDTIVINHRAVNAEKVNAWLAAGKTTFDLVGIAGVVRTTPGYEGISW